MPPSNVRQQAALYNDLIATAAGALAVMHRDGHLNDRWLHSLQAQLNATLYTLGYALPPGTIQIENVDTGDRIETSKVAPPKRSTRQG